MNGGALAGRRVVVTRATDQAGELAAQLEAAGAEVVVVPTIAVVPPADGGAAVRAALGDLRAGEWLVVTSANGAAAVLASGVGLAPGVRVACVGPKTAAVLEAAGQPVALVPQVYVAEALLDAFGPGDGTTVVVTQAAGARDVLSVGLAAAGWSVEPVVAYETVPAALSAQDRAAVAAADIATFTSASTVRALVAAVGRECVPPLVACIGPITAAAARELGLTVTAEASEHTVAGLVAAVCSLSGRSTSDGTTA